MTVPLCDHWIGGQSTPPESGTYFDVLNPLDDSLYTQAALGTATDVNKAVQAADGTFRAYRNSSPADRERWLIKAADLLEQQADAFIDALIDEIGSPISKARREVASSVSILRSAAGAARRLTGKTIPTDVPGRLSLSTRRPIGVVAGMTPFNVPLIKNIKHSAMPLATGNTVVLLPSESAPTTANLVARLFDEAGIPDGAFNVVFGRGDEIGDHLTTHPSVRLATFTGSTRVGRHVQELCGRHQKRVTLEMGGKNPLIVLADANLQDAVGAAVMGSFLYQGQICMATSRIYVEEPLYDDFIQQFVAATRQLKLGDLRDPSTMVGPIISGRQRDRIQQHIDDAVSKGASIVTGGEWSDNRCTPTILTNTNQHMLLHRNETFGPVTAVHKVSSADETLQQANDSDFGLCASVYTSDINAALAFAELLEVGMVHVNAPTIQDDPVAPFGGTGISGFGRESTDVDLEDMTEWKWITLQRVQR